MAAPDFVPTDPTDRVRVYTSPPRRNDPWTAGRPGELRGGQPRGERLGSIGPDQGYAFRLVSVIEDRLKLGETDRDDAIAGCVAVAMKRAALYGRAPVIHDVVASFTIFGFLDESPPADLVAMRRRLFPQVHSSHHYMELRHLVDLVPEDALFRPHQAIIDDHHADWRRNFDPDLLGS